MEGKSTRLTRRQFLKYSTAALAFAAGSAYLWRSYQAETPKWPVLKHLNKKVIVLGFDGVEPTLLEKWSQMGKLPNLSKLAKLGAYSRIDTTCPSQSPVAWATFSTGLNPAEHNIFDFMIRDPKSYMPRIGMVTAKKQLIGKPEVINNRQGDPIWKILSEKGVCSSIIRVPITFPAEKVNGHFLSGLGTPDIRGSIGTFSYYTTEKTSYWDNDMAYKLIKVKLKGGKVKTVMYGPQDRTIPLEFEVKGGGLRINANGTELVLEKGEWSDYIKVRFNLLSLLYGVDGICKFYVEEVKPNLRVYLSPIVFDPRSPFYPVSYPDDYCQQLVEEVGLFKTLGWDIDTWGLKEERIDEDTFIDDLNSTMDEQEKILWRNLDKGDWNFYAQVFQSTDVVQHVFWRYIDSKHPMHTDDPRYRDTIEKTYRRMDKVVGKAMKYVDKDTVLIVLSDHGFKPYRKSVDLNAWLVENGYMTLKDPSKRSDYLQNVYGGGIFWSNVNWEKTKAYGLGLGPLYINLRGREGKGAVSQKDYVKVREEIRAKLLSLKDPGTGQKVVSNVYRREDVMHGPYLKDAGDLLVGFEDGYRISWQTTFGSIPKDVIFDNKNKWSGDHCSLDSAKIPGVLFVNKEWDLSGATIADMAPTILDLFDVKKPLKMDGRSLVS